jgi:hypothetical protein
MSAPKRDLLVLVADSHAKAAVVGLLSRSKSLHVRRIDASVEVHHDRDPGCRLRGVEYVNAFARQFSHALLMFDYEGCGESAKTAEDMELELERELANSGWHDRAAVIVLNPELEIWVWSDSPKVDDALGWRNRPVKLRAWLESKSFLQPGAFKPQRPKDAMEAALHEAHLPHSAAIFTDLARSVSLARCSDRAFEKFKTVLSTWFPES